MGVGGSCDGEDVGDVGQGAVEDPEGAVEGAAVDDLDRQLDVGGIEKPEISGVSGQRHRLAVAAAAAVWQGPLHLDVEAAAGHAQRRPIRGSVVIARQRELPAGVCLPEV